MKLQQKSHHDEKAAAYLMVDEKDGQLEATYVATETMKTDLKSLVAAKLAKSNKDQYGPC